MGEYEESSLFSKYIRIFFVVAAYWIVSITTVFINKALLSGIDLDAPMFIAFYQTLITALICFIKHTLARVFPHRYSFPETNIFSINTLKTVLPVTLMFTGMIAANNLCLKYVSVAFYYIGRSLTTVFNVIFTYLILGERTSFNSLLCCALIVFGFYMGVDQENLSGSLSVAGTIFGVLASLSLSLYSIYTKRVLPKLNNEVWLLSYYNNVYSTLIFTVLIAINKEIPELRYYPEIDSQKFWFIMTVGGVCGFSIGFLTSLQIKDIIAMSSAYDTIVPVSKLFNKLFTYHTKSREPKIVPEVFL